MRLSKKYSRRQRQHSFACLALQTLAVGLTALLTTGSQGAEPSAAGVAETGQRTAVFPSYPRPGMPTFFGQRDNPSSQEAAAVRLEHRSSDSGSGLELFEENAESARLASSRNSAPSDGMQTVPYRSASPEVSPLNSARPNEPTYSSGISPAAFNMPSEEVTTPDSLIADGYGMLADEPLYGDCLDAACGLGCPKTWYGRVEALYIERVSDEGVTLSYQDPSGLPRLGHAPGARFTVGRIQDCLDGIEFKYTGFDEWDSASARTGNMIRPVFNIDWFPPGVDLSAFEDAQEHRQYRQHVFHSAELNKRRWGWDVISTYYGLRYLFIEEEYGFESIDVQDGIGTLDMQATNHMIGPQIGAEFFIPIGRLRSTLKFGGGAFANFAGTESQLVNDGVLQYANSRDRLEFGWLCDVGYFLNFQITQRLSAQAGYELWWIGTTEPLISPSYDRPNEVESVFYHGGSVGAEFVW